MESISIISDTRIGKIIGYDYLNIGPVPHEEQCIQAGDSMKDSILECKVYADLLLRTFNPPKFISKKGRSPKLFIMKNTQHDFGIYYDVNLLYPTDLDEDEELLLEPWFNLEVGWYIWDEKALNLLKEHKHSLYYNPPAIILPFKKVV